MELIRFNAARCTLCELCIQKCPFGLLKMGEHGIEVEDGCRVCSVCVKCCPEGAIYFEQKARTADKDSWKDILVYAELTEDGIHPVALELLGEAQRLAAKVGYRVHAVVVGPEGAARAAEELLYYGVDKVYVYQHEGFAGFKADCYTDAVADCIAAVRPSSVLVGATPLGRSLAPRLSTRFHTGLTADCTSLDMRGDTDLVQIRPAFGGDVMAQITIPNSRPQFATVRYKIMDEAKRSDTPAGEVVLCRVPAAMPRSRITVLETRPVEKSRLIEEEDILVVAGRGAASEEGVALCRRLADALGGQLAFTRPMVEAGWGDTAHQIGLSGRTVKPRLIITCGVSGAIQFTACMNGAETIVAIDKNPEAQIFKTASYCVADDMYAVLPRLLGRLAAAGNA